MSEKFSPLDYETLHAHKGKSYIGIAVTFMCHDGHGHFYMTKRGPAVRDEPGTWDVGGGGLKFGETAADGACREAIEEYGANILAPPQFLGYRDVFRTAADGAPTHWLTLDFLLLVDPDSMHPREYRMMSDSGWFTLDTLPTPRHSQMEKVYWDLHGDKLRKVFFNER